MDVAGKGSHEGIVLSTKTNRRGGKWASEKKSNRDSLHVSSHCSVIICTGVERKEKGSYLPSLLEISLLCSLGFSRAILRL